MVALIFFSVDAQSRALWTDESNATASPLLLSADIHSISLTGYFSYLRDVNSAFTFEEIAFGAQKDNFRPARKNISLGYTDDAAWLKVNLERKDKWPDHISLSFFPTYIDHIDIYIPGTATPRSTADFRHVARGDHHPQEQPGLLQFSFNLPLTLPDCDTATLYIRVKSTSTLSIGAWIGTLAGLADLTISRVVVSTMLMTMTFGTAVLGGMFWLAFRRSYFLKLSLILLTETFLIASLSGVFSSLQIGELYYLNDILVFLSITFAAIGNIAFVREHWKTRQQHPRLDIAIRLLLLAYLLSLPSIFLGFFNRIVGPLQLSAVAFLFVFFWIVVTRNRNPRKPGMTAATAVVAIKLAAATFAVFWTIGLVNSKGLLEYSYWIAVFMFTPLMALSLVQRARWLEQRRRASASSLAARKAEAEAALAREKEIQEEQLRFVDVIRHQYQTPLTVIRNSVATLAKTLSDDDKDNHARIDRIKVAIQDLVQMLDVSLHRSRVEQATIKPELKEVKIIAFIDSVVDRCRALFSDRQVDVFYKGLSEEDVISIDPSMMSLALTNLLDNSFKFSKRSIPVLVFCEVLGSFFTISIVDGGIGVPVGEFGSLGGRYFRGSNAGGVSGTGLGLHIVYRVVEAHGGVLEFQGNDLGGLSAFVRFRLRC